jgi:hypothetical protein
MSEAEQENFIGLFKAMGSGDIFFLFFSMFLVHILLLHGTLKNVDQVYHSKQEQQKRKSQFLIATILCVPDACFHYHYHHHHHLR